MSSPGGPDFAERGHRVLPHTADLIVEAWGPDLAACVEEALGGLIGICLASDSPRLTSTHRARFGPDRDDAVLLDVLDEAIYLFDTTREGPVEAAVRTPVGGPGDGAVLEVDFRLASPDTIESVGLGPKAISQSGVTVESSAGVVRCSFIVDV